MRRNASCSVPVSRSVGSARTGAPGRRTTFDACAGRRRPARWRAAPAAPLGCGFGSGRFLRGQQRRPSSMPFCAASPVVPLTASGGVGATAPLSEVPGFRLAFARATRAHRRPAVVQAHAAETAIAGGMLVAREAGDGREIDGDPSGQAPDRPVDGHAIPTAVGGERRRHLASGSRRGGRRRLRASPCRRSRMAVPTTASEFGRE